MRPFAQVKDHVLLPRASELDAVDAEYRTLLTPDRIAAIVSLVPDEWLSAGSPDETVEERRATYIQFLTTRLAHSAVFLNEARHAREALV